MLKKCAIQAEQTHKETVLQI